MEPISLNLSPSCQNCLSWSDDGIIAIAAGDHVHLLVPKNSKELVSQERGDQPVEDAPTPSPFHSLRFRTNTFPTKDWPIQDPANFKNFSIGEEQSTSHVVAIGWSPEGLGLHRRCVLGVLTSNCVLSFWEAKGHPREPKKWNRVGTANRALEQYWKEQIGGDEDEEDMFEVRRKKTRIRSFDWSPALKTKSTDPTNQVRLMRMEDMLKNPHHDRKHSGLDSSQVDKPQGDDQKWGIILLGITNDDGDTVLFRVHRENTVESGKPPIRLEIKGHINASRIEENPDSLQTTYGLRRDLLNTGFVRQISWGPWSSGGSNGEFSRSASLLALLRGTTLSFLRVEATELFPASSGNSATPQITIDFHNVTIDNRRPRIELQGYDGSLSWYRDRTTLSRDNGVSSSFEAPDSTRSERSTEQSNYHYLAVGRGNYVNLMGLHPTMYRHSHSSRDESELQEDEQSLMVSARVVQRTLTPANNGEKGPQSRVWEPISELAFTTSESDRRNLHMSTASSFCANLNFTLSGLFDNEPVHFTEATKTDWVSQAQSLREKFDDEYDLGGLSIVKVRGLASFEDCIASCVTPHPGDLIEYNIPSDAKAAVIFESAGSGNTSSGPFAKHGLRSPMSGRIPSDGISSRSRLEAILLFVLLTAQPGKRTTLDKLGLQAVQSAKKFIEQANSSPISGVEYVHDLLRLSKAADRWLASQQMEDKTRETTSALTVTSPDEICTICTKRIPWSGGVEAQCEGGHVFGRCGLSSLAIQEPGKSKFCSSCETEFFNEIAVLEDSQTNGSGSTRQAEDGGRMPQASSLATISKDGLFWKLFNFFDSCPYCHGKYYT